jgi:hypothetical protein
MNQICLRPRESDSGSHTKTHLILSFFFFFLKFFIPVLTWVKTIKLIFSPIFTQNENSRYSMLESYWEPV